MALGSPVRYGSDGNVYLNVRTLQNTLADSPDPLLEQTRRYYGRALTPAMIEAVLRAADLGYMRDLTDLIYETVAIDPHLYSVTGKRLRSLSSMKPQVIPATGDGIDERFAQLLADVVRQQLNWIPNFRQVVTRLNWGHCHGRAASEKIWRENPAGSNVQWRIDRINWIHPRRLAFGPDRELRVRDDLFDGIPFSPRGLELRAYPFKFICFTPQLFNDYAEREGFGPHALYWSFFKRFSWRERMVLLEVFGKPWRIAYVEDPRWQGIQKEAIDQAQQTADNLGANASGGMPPGVKVDTQQVDPRTGENHHNTAVDADDQISKLVLGQTRTTDAKPNAIGSTGDEVAQSEQDEIYNEDGGNISDLLTEYLAADIVVLNFGAEALDHCPRIELKYERKKVPQKELERAKVLVVDLGAPIKRDELYERAGFTKPEPGDDVVEAPKQPALPGLPGLDLPGLDGTDSDASPLGDGGESVPEQKELKAGAEVALLRAARVLKLLQEIEQGGR